MATLPIYAPLICPVWGPRRIRPNYMSGQTRLYHHKERMINQPTARNDTHTPVSTNKNTPGNSER
ncbi:hypothetical protein RHMOL_Rhmol09G0104800 [Rhododendron molle]|uniref:Uncharacterized protein n=1 Tax=Rhododendron molle TaxID=49168 RepID=A0ACC0MBP3_RHOML|nr:hypothetical protein RHMOL_Rhmol09G0104800 [Rhododendron molle]